MLQTRGPLRLSSGRRSAVAPCCARTRPATRKVAIYAFKGWLSNLVRDNREAKEQTSSQDSSISATISPAPALAPATPKRDFLEARQVSLYNLFDGREFAFDLPCYQRPYSWQTRHVYELLQDFVSAFHARQEYFLGAIVATKASGDGPQPYQLIDGQQRLTTLVLLLAYLRHRAAEAGDRVLQERLRGMVWLGADALDPTSVGRYRLKLRDSDDAFFRCNILDAFLPTPYRLEGVAAQQGPGATAGEQGAEAAAGEEGAPAVQPIRNASWWRLYDNASFLAQHLDGLVEREGLSLQDFTFHVLRNCHVVLMVARDEGASFRIFSSLNGRGMDLTEVDKLKADLLQCLTPEERAHYSDAWAEMESVLGRPSFHAVFDHMRELAAVRDPAVRDVAVLPYFTRKAGDPVAVKQILQVALDYARLMLQLKQASWAPPALAAALAETPAEQQQQQVVIEDEPIVFSFGEPSASGAARSVTTVATEAVDGSVAAAAAIGGEAAVAVLGSEQEAGPGSLGLTYMYGEQEQQVGSVEALQEHVSSLQGELQQQWGEVQERLNQQLGPEAGVGPEAAGHWQVPHAAAQAMTLEERLAAQAAEAETEARRQAELLSELDARSRLLNLFSDQEAWLPPLLEFFYQTEDLELRAAFMKGAEALQLYLELEGNPATKAARWAHVSHELLQRPFSPGAVLTALQLTNEERHAFRSRLDSKDLAATAPQRTLRHLLLRCEPASVLPALPQPPLSGLTVERIVPQNAPEGSQWRRTRIASACDPEAPWPEAWWHGTAGAASSPSPYLSTSSTSGSEASPLASSTSQEAGATAETSGPSPSYDVKYWFEVQRMQWHGKLGNLALLPATLAGAAAAGCTADWEAKAELWRAAGVRERLPGFTWPVVDPQGRYGRFRFCFNECQQRHIDLMERLCDEFEL